MSRDEPRVYLEYRSVCDILCDTRKCVTKSEKQAKKRNKASIEIYPEQAPRLGYQFISNELLSAA